MVPVSDLRLVTVAVVFAALLGLGLGRSAADRRPVLWATAATAALGVVLWAGTQPPEDSDVAVAVVSLALGGTVAFLAVLTLGRRDERPPR